MHYKITASVVTYKNDLGMLTEAFRSFLNTNLIVKLYVVDNSPTSEIEQLCNDPRVEYIFNNKNVGFGTAHNIAIRKAWGTSEYHLVLNPDVYFEQNTLEKIVHFMDARTEVGLVIPRVLYPDGSFQYAYKLLPTPLVMFCRRFFKVKKVLDRLNYRFEYRFADFGREMEVPYMNGSFLFFRTAELKRLGLFDERIFMYMEDADISRRFFINSKALYYPGAVVYHRFGKGAHKSFKLMLRAVEGTIIYFNKWGWIFDKERRKINRKLIREYSIRSKKDKNNLE